VDVLGRNGVWRVWWGVGRDATGVRCGVGARGGSRVVWYPVGVWRDRVEASLGWVCEMGWRRGVRRGVVVPGLDGRRGVKKRYSRFFSRENVSRFAANSREKPLGDETHCQNRCLEVEYNQMKKNPTVRW
jgi:hypothetical protein